MAVEVNIHRLILTVILAVLAATPFRFPGGRRCDSCRLKSPQSFSGCAQESAMNVGFAGISGFLVGEQILSRA
jgi:hypothetical protein